MITLRTLAKTDRAIGAITTDECHLIAAVLDVAARSWWFRRRLPKELRHKALAMRMLAAVLGRTPDERKPGLESQIRQAMERDHAK